ncbi:hypothetical protein D1610_03025 [Sphingomonas gilva]|uniref:DUF2264 domain-containing protein n=1 Tax=Sphingomonas gilva TaxID=2305907 RepID=A0A396S6Q5_9SPHN|nr:hypothetical protein [Sphingomonas gilva]RHW19105.1 hypothetical protein D1610_03025 [Sphingomonas gilva]
MNATVERRLMPQMERLLQQLLREKRAMRLDGVAVFGSGDKFLPGKIASGLAMLLLETPRDDPRFAGYLAGFRDIADLTLADTNESWGIYYYVSALHDLKQAGLLDQAVRPETLAALRRKLDWRSFVDSRTLELKNLPNNYYGVAFSIARLRMLMGWEDASASEALFERMLDHYREYSGEYGFADETPGDGRFDRYSVLLIGEIAHRLIETGLEPTAEVKGWLRKSAELMLLRFNLTGEGWEYGRSIGAYGESAFLEVLTAAAKLDVLTPEERDMAYAFSSRIAARYMDFWVDPRTGSVNLWDDGRRTDAYRGKHRILGENLSLARQHHYTNAIWNELGYRGRAPSPHYARWLDTLPKSSFLYFARGEHDRALLTIRDGGHVIGLPLINGAAGQHMNSPYFPIPYGTDLVAGAADASFPLLVPRFTLKDGSVLMPLAWFRDVAMRREGGTTIVTYRMDAMDRMGGNDAVADPRLTVTTRYVFSAGRIERSDEYRASRPLDIVAVDMEFAGFAREPARTGPTGFTFAQGSAASFTARGFKGCDAQENPGPPYAAPDGPMMIRVACRTGAMTLDQPLKLGWTLVYR